MRVSTKGQNPRDMGKGEGDFPAPGKYHVLVKEVDDSFEKQQKSIPVEFEIIAGTPSDQRGKTTREYFYFEKAWAANPDAAKDFAVERLSRFFWACGLLSENEERDVETRETVGCQLVVELHEEEYEKDGKAKKSTKISWQNGGCWPLGDPDVAAVPVDAEAAKARKTRDATSASAAPAAAATGGGGMFDGI